MQKIDHYSPHLILLANLFFVQLSISIIIHNGGPHNVSYYILPFSLLINLFLWPSFKLMFNKNNSNKNYILMNRVGFGTIIIFVLVGIISIYI